MTKSEQLISPNFPSRRDLPLAFDLAVAAIPDLVVQVHAGADVAGNDPNLLADAGHIAVQLHMAVLLAHLRHRPALADEATKMGGTHGPVVGKGLRARIDNALARH